jgi:hypothetical protein
MMQAAGIPTLRKSRSVGQPLSWWCPRQANLGQPPPGINGTFYGLTATGMGISVETNVTHSSWTLGLMSFRPWPVSGLTYGNGGPNQLNYVAANEIGYAAGIEPSQIHELGHALDNFTSGKTSEASADTLMNCVINSQ